MNYLKLAQVCKINMGQSPESSTYNNEGDGLPFFQGNADFGEICPVARIWCNRPTKIAQEGDILISVRAPIGSINYATEMCCIGRGLAAITPDTKKVSSDFIYWLLKAKNAELNSKGTGSTFKAIGKKVLEEFLVPNISLEKQKKYTEVIKNTFEIIHMRQMQKRTLDNLIKARFIEMFGDPATNNKGWNTKPLLSMGSCKNGMNFHYNDSGVVINCLGVGDFKDYSIISDAAQLPTVSLNEMPSSEYLLKDDDIVFVRSNGNIKMVGRSVAVYPGAVPTTFSGFCIRYRKEDNSVITPYLLMVLKMESMRQKMYGRGANIQNLNQQILSSLNVPVPPMVLQEHFASFVSQVDKSKLLRCRI